MIKTACLIGKPFSLSHFLFHVRQQFVTIVRQIPADHLLQQ
jgi:hypothetical protein